MSSMLALPTRSKETSDKLELMWSSLSDKARYVIAITDWDVLLYYFSNLDTPEEVNKFFEEEW